MRKLFFLYQILFTASIFFGQDILVKRDSTKIEAKILEISPAEIKYLFFNYQDGPILIINKSDVAYAIYSNGTRETFNISPEAFDPPLVSPIYKYIETVAKARKDSIEHAKLNKRVKLNIELGVVINENYINKPYNYSYSGSQGHFPNDDETFQPIGKKHYNYGIQAGANLLSGRSPYCKHLFGVNFLQSNSSFHYIYSKYDYYESHSTKSVYTLNANYYSSVYFANIMTGLRFTIFKKFHIDNCISFNIPLMATNTISGYEATTDYTNYYYTRDSRPANSTVDEFKNKTTHDMKVGTTVSFIPRISYDLAIKKTLITIFFSYNIAYRYNLPWYSVGLAYFPFKKLR